MRGETLAWRVSSEAEETHCDMALHETTEVTRMCSGELEEVGGVQSQH